MAGEPILVVDDTPVNLKLTRILLANAGYKVVTAASAEEALDLLRGYRPRLILADIQLPGIDGLEMTRRIKHDPATSEIIVVAVTAFATKGDEQKAFAAGCDAYITKPIDTRALGQRIRELLDGDGDPQSPPPSRADGLQAEAITPPELAGLRHRFLREGQEKARELLLDLDGQFKPGDAARVVHQWTGTGGLLGYTEISRLAHEVEALLQERPLDAAQVRESLTSLVLAFTSPREARDVPMPENIIQSLAGKTIGSVGLPASETKRLQIALERADVRHLVFPPDSAVADALASCDLLVVYVRSDGAGAHWRDPESPALRHPLVLMGTRDDLLALDPAVQSAAREFLMDAWQPDEALLRLSLALGQKPGERPSARPAAFQGSPRVLLAGDDATLASQVRIALENFGMQCESVSDGRAALEAIRHAKPHAAVVDLNIPGIDGYEVLMSIRAENLPTRVLLLTARQQESNVIRGFALGADDYVVKPFSPMELVTRLKRILIR